MTNYIKEINADEFQKEVLDKPRAEVKFTVNISPL
jgi:hypothetical protein